MMDDTCPECFEDDETEYIISQQSRGAVGLYCWRCEALVVDLSAFDGEVVEAHDL